MQSGPSLRSLITTTRTYSRMNPDGSFENFPQIIERTIQHQRFLWSRALGRPLNTDEELELEELRALQISRKTLLAGRTLFLGGTPISQTREASQFNCSFSEVLTVHDIVDESWLLLQGCGDGFVARPGNLFGFPKVIPNVEVLRSKRTSKGGAKNNKETILNGVWTLRIGDSAEAWAKAIGKLVAGKHPNVTHLVLDFTEIRPGGERLASYGWISSGDSQLAVALPEIVKILNSRAGLYLREPDIRRILNWVGTILSSRRSAQIALHTYGKQGWEDFARCKRAGFMDTNWELSQANNSLIFETKPTRHDLQTLFDIMSESSNGSEPGLVNATASRNRFPEWAGTNPCGEILLPNKGFCNLVEVDVAKFRNDHSGLLRAMYIIARANYRQTCVNLKDGILQDSWHQNNENMRLCGVGLTGIVRRPDLTPYDFRMLRREAWLGACSMADALGFQRPANVTTIKPSGTMSKIMDTSEGIHKPLGRYIFNKILFPADHEMLPDLTAAGYEITIHPNDPGARLVKIPFEFPDVPFEGTSSHPVNLEPALSQLQRYKTLQDNYTDHNSSITVSYDPSEIPDIIDWLDQEANWSSVVGLSFMHRTDPFETEEEARIKKNYPYLPQVIVDKETYNEYVKNLRPFAVRSSEADASDSYLDGCVGGACPVR